jgi:hypothetical protein
MTSEELMALARRAVEAALADRDLEDSRIELKSQWPEPQGLARQLAAMANSRGQQEFVWLIGIRRGRGAVGATNQDGSVWLPAVRTEFDEGLMPVLVQHENLDVGGSNVVALVWDPRDPPYLVKAPAGRGFEVLWREGESIRPARRRDLLKILEPIISAPQLEQIWDPRAHIAASLTDTGELAWSIRISCRLRPRSTQPVVIPYRATVCRLALPLGEESI